MDIETEKLIIWIAFAIIFGIGWFFGYYCGKADKEN